MTKDEKEPSTAEMTSEMNLEVHKLIKERDEEVRNITGGDIGKQLLIRELMAHSYVLGYFAGMARAEESKQ